MAIRSQPQSRIEFDLCTGEPATTTVVPVGLLTEETWISVDEWRLYLMAVSSVSWITSNGAAIEVGERGSGKAIVLPPAVCMEAGAADGAGAGIGSEEILVLLGSSAFKDVRFAVVEILVPGDVTLVICPVDGSASAWDVLPSVPEAEILEVRPRPSSAGASAFTVDDGVFDEALVVFCSMNAAPELMSLSVEVFISETVLEDVVPTAARLVAVTETDPPDDLDDVPAGPRPM